MIGALLSWFSSALSWLASHVGSLFASAWGMVQGVVDVLGAVIVTVIGQLLAWVVALVFGILGLFTALMPEVSDPGSVGGAIGFLAEANRYIPLAEALALLPIWGAIFLGVTVYKAWKALPLT